jgi:hypothetical protein
MMKRPMVAISCPLALILLVAGAARAQSYSSSPDGTLLREDGTAPVYVINGGAKLWVQAPTEVKQCYGDWGAVQVVPNGSLASITTVPRDGTLEKGVATQEVYLIMAGQRRWIPDPATFDFMGLDWGSVRKLCAAELDALPLGAPVPRPSGMIQLYSDMGAHHYMTTHGVMLSTGHIDAQTRTQTLTWLGGFTGGVQLLLEDQNGITIGASSIQTFGVDGTWIGRSDRTDYWSEEMDPALAARTVAIHVYHFPAPKYSALQNLVNAAVAALRPILDLIKDIKGLGGDAK